MRGCLLICLLFFFVESCKDKKELLSPKKMQTVMWDMIQLEAYTQQPAVMDSLKRRHIAIAGLQQQIPFSGQKSVPYDYYGRKSSLSDYVPSIYLRLEKDKKWFVQTEFRYGAPQSIKDFSYSRQTKLDIANNNLTTTTYRLKKTYYHQLPLSFNYYILPNWSVGAGGIYNRFYGAVTEKEVNNKNAKKQTFIAFRFR